MRICEADPWRLQYFEHVPCPPDVRIPTEDADVWSWYPDYRFVYDKIVVLFAPHGLRYHHPPSLLVAQVRQLAEVSSVQITFHEDKDPSGLAMPPGGFRLAVVNAWSLAGGLAGREFLRMHFL